MRRLAMAGALLLSGCVGVSGPVAPFGTITHTAKHINATRTFNEVNPGVGVGAEAALTVPGWRVGGEAGAFRNSNDGVTRFGAVYANYPVFGRVRAGGFYGLAEYPDEADRNRDRGQFALGDFIPVLGVQATVPTVAGHAFRFRATPGLSRADAIITLQSIVSF